MGPAALTSPAGSEPTMSRFSLIRITDSITTCDCCGKDDLKCTMELQNAEGWSVFYGRDCGARALGWKVSADRAEKLVAGTARVDAVALSDAWRASKADGCTPSAPARVQVDGVTLEVWDTFWGRAPAGRPWAKASKSKGETLVWRAAA